MKAFTYVKNAGGGGLTSRGAPCREAESRRHRPARQMTRRGSLGRWAGRAGRARVATPRAFEPPRVFEVSAGGRARRRIGARAVRAGRRRGCRGWPGPLGGERGRAAPPGEAIWRL